MLGAVLMKLREGCTISQYVSLKKAQGNRKCKLTKVNNCEDSPCKALPEGLAIYSKLVSESCRVRKFHLVSSTSFQSSNPSALWTLEFSQMTLFKQETDNKQSSTICKEFNLYWFLLQSDERGSWVALPGCSNPRF